VFPSKLLARIKSRQNKGRETGTGRLASVVVLALAMTFLWYDPVILKAFRFRVFDIYNHLQPREVQAERPVMIADIDEKSLRELGQWPWSRSLMARLVDRLNEFGASVIAFDVTFPERDRLSPAVIAERLPGLDADAKAALLKVEDSDEVFAAAIARANVVMGQAVLTTAEETTDDITQDNTSLGFVGSDPRVSMLNWGTMLRSLSMFNEAATGHGLFTVDPGIDGIIRYVPLVMQVQGELYPSLSVEMLRIRNGGDAALVKASRDLGIERIMIKPDFIETDGFGQFWIYFSYYDPAKYLSVYDILTDDNVAEKVRDKMILVGTSATGMMDIRSSPLNSVLPGVEVHAQIIENVLTNEQLRRSHSGYVAELAAALAVGILFIILVPIFSAQTMLLIVLSVTGGVFGLSWLAFKEFHSLYDPVSPVLIGLVIYMFLSYRSFVREEGKRQEVREAFSHYLSPEVVQELALNPDALNLGGEMRDMTIMFSDIRRFTSISERLTAEELTQLINSYLTPMTDIVLNNHGTIDKYIGDCIMAFWNAPIVVENHALQACRTALQMEKQLDVFNDQWRIDAEEAGLPFTEFRIGIGINSGIACVGNIGSEQRFSYSVLGDCVNVSSRLEELTKTYGVTTIVGEESHHAIPDLATLELDVIRVKGREEPQKIYVLMGDEEFASSAEFITLREPHDEMLRACRNGEYATAAGLVKTCRAHPLAVNLEKVYRLYEDHIQSCLENPPETAQEGIVSYQQPSYQMSAEYLPQT